MFEIAGRIRQFVDQRIQGQKKSEKEKSAEEKIQLLKASVSDIASRVHEPVRLVVNKETFWFDGQGEETNNDNNKARFENMLTENNIGSFSGKKIDEINDDIRFVQGKIAEMAEMMNSPIKINHVWFDAQGGIVKDQSQIVWFETSFGSSKQSG